MFVDGKADERENAGIMVLFFLYILCFLLGSRQGSYDGSNFICVKENCLR